MKQAPLPTARAATGERVTIAAGELRDEPDLIENARVLASSIEADIDPPHPIVERTVVRLRKATPDAITGLVDLDVRRQRLAIIEVG